MSCLSWREQSFTSLRKMMMAGMKGYPTASQASSQEITWSRLCTMPINKKKKRFLIFSTKSNLILNLSVRSNVFIHINCGFYRFFFFLLLFNPKGFLDLIKLCLGKRLPISLEMNLVCRHHKTWHQFMLSLHICNIFFFPFEYFF